MDFKCEIVTPLLMHGANSKKAELRSPSIKGIMRFWWRAIHGNLSLEKLKEKEAEIFGDITKKSSFSMKINSINLEKDKFNPLPHKSINFKIEGYKPNQNFDIVFSGTDLDIIKDIFELTTILGGFGQRARRGFGSVRMVENDEDVNIDYINNLIKRINPDFNYSVNLSNEYPFIRTIEIGKVYSNYNDLLKQIGGATHKYPYFGSANPRFASPIYVSIIKDKEGYRPIVTTLNSTRKILFNQMNDFKEMILKELNE